MPCIVSALVPTIGSSTWASLDWSRPQEPIEIKYTNREHPITKPLSDWTTIKEELYNNVKLHDAVPLATGKQKVKGRGGKETTQEFVVAWINEKRGARSFSTTIGHNNDTVADPRYLELITRGVLWACKKLEPEYLVPFKGTNKITFIPAKPKLPMVLARRFQKKSANLASQAKRKPT